jgi:hypothetical protein
MAVAACVVVGCGTDAPVASPGSGTRGTSHVPASPTTRAVGTTSTTAAAPTWSPEQQAVVDALSRALQARDAAAAAGNGFTEEMSATHTDPYLSKVRNRLLDRRRAGQSARYPANTLNRVDPLEVAFLDDGRAVVTACSIDDAVIYESASGTVINDAVTTALVRYLLVRAEGVWKVSEYEIVGRKDGASTCDNLF